MTTDDLFAAIVQVLPDIPPPDARCHVGICSQSECSHCQRVNEAHVAVQMLKDIVAQPNLTIQLTRLRSMVQKPS